MPSHYFWVIVSECEYPRGGIFQYIHRQVFTPLHTIEPYVHEQSLSYFSSTPLPSSLLSIICPCRPLEATYLCRQAPCQSSCHQSGRHDALNPQRGNSLSDRCTPGCNRKREGLDPRRQHWPGSVAACRSELESTQRVDALYTHSHLHLLHIQMQPWCTHKDHLTHTQTNR